MAATGAPAAADDARRPNDASAGNGSAAVEPRGGEQHERHEHAVAASSQHAPSAGCDAAATAATRLHVPAEHPAVDALDGWEQPATAPPGQMPPTQIPPPGMGIPPWQQGQQGPMRPPPPGTAPPPGFPGWQPQQMGGWPPAAPVPPPPQQQTPAPPGIDLNTLPTLLAQPPPPPPPTS